MVTHLLWLKLDPSAVINSIYLLVLDWIALTSNKNRTGVQMNSTPDPRFLEDSCTAPWCAPEFRKQPPLQQNERIMTQTDSSLHPQL